MPTPTTAPSTAEVTAEVETVMADLQQRVRARLQADVLRHGASPLLRDDALFQHVEQLLRNGADRSHPAALLLPELLGDPAHWRLETALQYRSHRGGAAAGAIVFLKRRLLTPLFRWFFEYSRDNFERQRHVNDVLFACVQELAIETARLRQDVSRLSPK